MLAVFLLSFVIGQSYAQTFSDWLNSESQVAQSKLLAAMSQAEAAPGAVIASPSKSKPDYYYHWTRDAAISQHVIVGLYQRSHDNKFKQKILDYIQFSRANQLARTLTDLGEPKFYVDGTPYGLPWGRPQNDGPALRALTLIEFAQLELQQGHRDFVEDHLYKAELPAMTVIKADLEYVSHHWQEPSFDLWEEVQGDHFFTRLVQKAALTKGAQLAQIMNDPAASDWYLRQAQKIDLEEFMPANQDYILTTLRQTAGLQGKNSNLDSAVTLGFIRIPDMFNIIRKVPGTLRILEKTFGELYTINRRFADMAPAIGRYPEDVYDGDTFRAGNPWVISTLAQAESYYRLAQQSSQKNKTLALEYFKRGDDFFKRVQFHANPDGSLSEQISRENGYMVSAVDLTWNYAAFMTALWAREEALK